MFKVIFEYCELSKKWEVYVEGARDDLEAKQGFNAVVISCDAVIPEVTCNKAELQSDGRYKISVGQL